MRALPSILCGFLLLLAPAGCTNQAVTKVKEMADRACACADAACGDKVDKEFWDYAKGPQKRGTKDDHAEVQGHYQRLRECVVKLRSAGGGEPATSASAVPGAKKGAQ